MTGRRTRLAGPLLLVALASAPLPAAAETSFLESIFGGGDKPAQAERSPDAEPDAAAKRASAPKPQKDKPAAEKPADKPASKAAAKPPAQGGERLAAAGASSTASSLEDAAPEVIVARANAYFNSFQTLTGTFLQIGPDGRKIGGKLYLAKPGRLRFTYDDPSPIELVADGTSVAIRDRKLNTQDVFFINQTPLKFLIGEKIDLARDLTVTEVTSDPLGFRVALEDRATLGGTSKIQLFFDAEMKTLGQWRITDPQGYLTTVQLSNLQKGKPVDPTLFFIDYGRPEDKAIREQIKRNEAQAQ